MSEAAERKELRVDHRHLAIFFLGAVAVCAVFFILGYIVGRGRSHENSSQVPAVSMAKAGEEGKSPLAPATLPGSVLPAGQNSSRESKSSGLATSGAGTGNEPGGKDIRQDLDFYRALKQENAPAELKTPPPVASKPPSTEAMKSAAKAGPGKESAQKSTAPSLSLQVAALRSLGDAEKLMKVLQSKGYEVFIVKPGSGAADQYIRVQVGTFSSEKEAALVKGRLEKDGYKSITKR